MFIVDSKKLILLYLTLRSLWPFFQKRFKLVIIPRENLTIKWWIFLTWNIRNVFGFSIIRYHRLTWSRLACLTKSSCFVDRFGRYVWFCHLEFDEKDISVWYRSKNARYRSGFWVFSDFGELSICDQINIKWSIDRAIHPAVGEIILYKHTPTLLLYRIYI